MRCDYDPILKTVNNILYDHSTCKISMTEDLNSHRINKYKSQGISCSLGQGKAKSDQNRRDLRPINAIIYVLKPIRLLF